MKDAEARELIAALDRRVAELVTELPAACSDAMMVYLKPELDKFNELVERVNVTTAQLATQGELLEVMEAEANATRVDLNAQRAAAIDLSERLTAASATLTGLMQGLTAAADQAQARLKQR